MKTMRFSQFVLVVIFLLTACNQSPTSEQTTAETLLPASPYPSLSPVDTLTPTTEPTSVDVNTPIPVTPRPRPSNTPIPQLPKLPDVGSNLCPGTQPSLLMPGRQGRVSNLTPDPNRVRSEPNTQSDILGEIPAGAYFDVLEGPNCVENAAWFKVRYENIEGWTQEGSSTQYWVMPITSDAREVSGSNITVSGLTFSLPTELGTFAQIQDLPFDFAENIPPVTLIRLPEYQYYDQSPSIYIYPVEDYLYYRTDLRPRLEGIRSTINFLIRDISKDLPEFRDAFHAENTTLVQVGRFNNGWGLHAAAVSADDENGLYYVFMGFTGDMKTLLYARIPIRLPYGQLVTASVHDFSPPLTQIDTMLGFYPNYIPPSVTDPSLAGMCPGAPPFTLAVGDWVRVSVEPPMANRIRSTIGIAGTVIGEAQPGENLLVIDGPQCANSYTWWKVRTLEGLEGWAAEGDTDSYWLVEPIAVWYQLPSPLSAGNMQHYTLREINISAAASLVNDISGGYSALATPVPVPENMETPMPENSCASEFSSTFCAAHSAYGISSNALSGSYMVVYDLQDPLSRYYLSQQPYAECTNAWLQNLVKDPPNLANIQPFCGMGQGIPIHWIANVQSIQFSGGRGLRFLITSANYQTVNRMEYIFQGLSDDGRYYIVAHLRSIYHPYIVDGIVSATQDFGPLLAWKVGQYDEAQASYDVFNQRILTLLNAHLIPLYPQLSMLDEMVSSIEIK